VKFVESNEASMELGEPALPPVAATLDNAIYAATAKEYVVFHWQNVFNEI